MEGVEDFRFLTQGINRPGKTVIFHNVVLSPHCPLTVEEYLVVREYDPALGKYLFLKSPTAGVPSQFQHREYDVALSSHEFHRLNSAQSGAVVARHTRIIGIGRR